MKRLIILICILIPLACYSAVEDLYGVWGYENIEYTFEPDSMMIDEIDIEGFVYTYTVKNDSIFYQDAVFNDITYIFEIKYLTKNELTLRTYDEELDAIIEFTLYRRKNK